AIVREIAQQHHAEIALEDANLRYRIGVLAEHGGVAFGPGVRFTVRFPAAQAQPAHANPPS
ncbi:MAG TPA: hypothetical protein VHQ87_15105, partial [Rhizobacter sp.]|nr:hypothetical protein [Rhizobacter sp.]